MHVQSCCFTKQTYCLFDVLVAAVVVLLKLPIEGQAFDTSRFSRVSSHLLCTLQTSALVDNDNGDWKLTPSSLVSGIKSE